MARSALSLIFGSLTLLSAASASAAGLPAAVHLEIRDCPLGMLKLADAYQAARLELEQAGITSVQGEGSASEVQADLTASLRCDRGVEATLRLSVQNEPASAGRVISLSDAQPKDRPRVLGLALAELVRSDWAGLVERSTPVEPSPATPAKGAAAPGAQPATAAAAASPQAPSSATSADGGAAEPGHPAAASDSSRLAFCADAIVRWFTVYRGVTLGAAFGVEHGRFSVGVEAAAGRHATARGTANYGFGAATLGASVLRVVSSGGRFTLGPKVALGGTWATGESSQADVAASGTGGLYADARVEAAAAVRLSAVEVGARLGGGRATGLSITDQGNVIGATGGWFLGGALGARW